MGIKFDLEDEDLKVIGYALGELKWKIANPVITRMDKQVAKHNAEKAKKEAEESK